MKPVGLMPAARYACRFVWSIEKKRREDRYPSKKIGDWDIQAEILQKREKEMPHSDINMNVISNKWGKKVRKIVDSKRMCI